MTVPSLLALLGPPCLGAAIGYLTNALAIRMLFRPLKPWRLLGVRLPFTPGVIPAKRHELARNIGIMVGSHLLTREEISQALQETRFQDDLRLVIEERVAKLLARELGTPAELVPARFRSSYLAGVKVLRWRLGKLLRQYLASPPLTARLRELLEQQLQRLLAQPLDRLLAPADQERLLQGLEKRLESLLADPQLREWLTSHLDQQWAAFLAKGGSLAELLPPELSTPLLDLLEEQAPHLLTRLARLVEEPAMQEKIARRIADSVTTALGGLGPLAALLNSLLPPERLREKIQGFLAERGRELTDWLLDDQVQRQGAALLRQRSEKLLATPLRELLARLEPEKQAAGRQWLAAGVARALLAPATARGMVSLLRERLARDNQSLASLLGEVFGAEPLEEAVSRLARSGSELASSTVLRRFLDGMLTELLEERLQNRPLGALTNLLPREVQAGISDFLLEQINLLLAREVPRLLDALDIQSLVTRKVDSLDLGRLESLLLSIMEEQFTYINLFGGLLGFVIGLANLLFLR